MKLLLSFLLLASFCALSSWSTALNVTQIESLKIGVGETLNISCCWTGGSGKPDVTWLKNQTEVRSSRYYFSESNDKHYCAYLIIEEITKEPPAVYICKVGIDIPTLKETPGNGGKGTIVEVTDRKTDQPTSSYFNSLCIALAVVAALLIIALCFYKKRQQPKAPSVIYEVPCTKEDTNMDGHSTGSSAGSCQWRQVPVYESFDYFECVQAEDPI